MVGDWGTLPHIMGELEVTGVQEFVQHWSYGDGDVDGILNWWFRANGEIRSYWNNHAVGVYR